jgi:hypothetical protein
MIDTDINRPTASVTQRQKASPSACLSFNESGGEERGRTADLYDVNVAL